MNLNKQAPAIIFNFKNTKILLYPFPFLKKPKRFFSTLPFPPRLIFLFDATTASENKLKDRSGASATWPLKAVLCRALSCGSS